MIATRFKWLVPILILVLVLVPVLGSISCEPGELLYYLVRSVTCGVEIFADGSYQGITEQLPGWLGCVFLGTITGSEHKFDFVIPGSVVAVAASAASGKLMTASEVPDITASYEGPLVDGGRYEVKLSAPTESGGVATVQNMNETYEETIVFEVSSAPFEHPATRALPALVEPGANFDVTITTSGCGAFGQVVETLPSGFSYISCASTEVSVITVDNTIKFTFIGDSVTFTYTVKASFIEGVYTFSGVVKDADKVEYPIGGDENIMVGFDPMNYDADGDGVIEIGEVLTAISDYFAGEITITQVLEVIVEYMG